MKNKNANISSDTHNLTIDFISPIEGLKVKIVKGNNNTDEDEKYFGITKEQDNNGEDIWKSEIFGRSLDVIVQEGIQAKLSMMPDTIRYKLGNTLTKVINKGSNNMIAIVL